MLQVRGGALFIVLQGWLRSWCQLQAGKAVVLNFHTKGELQRMTSEAVSVFLPSDSPRGIPRRVVVSRDLPRSERDGARNTRILIGSCHRSVIPYVLCGGLYSLRCCSVCLVPFEGVPNRPYMIRGNRVTWKVLVEFC